MIQKHHLKSRPVCKVTFELPDDYVAEQVELYGDFTDWKPIPFKKLKNGKWKVQLDVEPGARYEFRYRGRHQSGNEWWDNDPSADSFVTNPFGGKNSLIVC